MSVAIRRTLLSALLVLAIVPEASAQSCDVSAEVVALNQPFILNRLGAWVPQGMIYALKREVVPDTCYDSGGDCTASGAPPFTLQAGKVQLRRDRRPRPLVLRVNEGQCLSITLWNMLPSAPPPFPCPAGVPSSACQPPNVPLTRGVSIHVQGLELAASINDDGSYVGRNDYSLVNPGDKKTYQLIAAREGTHLMYSMGANFDQATVGGTFMGTATNGMFGSVTVQPAGAEYYRSQVTNEDLLRYAILRDGSGNPRFTPQGQPLINYQARYPANHSRACWPVLRMVATPQGVSGGKCQALLGAKPETFYGDLTAIITGPNTGNFTGNSPTFDLISASPQRRQPYREFTIHYHELNNPTQAFNAFNGQPECDPSLGDNAGMGGVLTPGSDLFAINYGTGGISAEILANRYKVGPQKDCVDCKFEEFFLSAWSVGDPASVTDVTANKELPCAGQAFPTKVLFPDDPSNVYHSYLNDHTKFRVLHAGATLTHVHHQHAHQWLHSPNDNDSTYLDSQMISPGSAYTLEIDYHGSGNRNRTIGDMIFHCHFYPHFAAGMWSMWRVHDVFEGGTQLDPNGVPVKNARAQPDGELKFGTPIPALVPVPTLVMPPLPSYTTLDATGRKAVFGGTCFGGAVNGIPVVGGCTDTQHVNGKAGFDNKFRKTRALENPGFPFFVPGIAGLRPPHPPLDFACEEDPSGKCKEKGGKPVLLDGGLPRHLVVDGTVSREHHNVWDFTKDNDTLDAVELPEDGTPEEKAAIEYNKIASHPSFRPNGTSGPFRTNGLPRGPQHGAPFADPAVFMDGSLAGSRLIRYKAADIQTDVVFNKRGWHYPQQRFITLWEDVQPMLKNTGDNLPQPFFFRANSEQDIIEYWLANLVPAYYELDDFQVRTPTDILGQHIHLVKFDVLASDGAANGFNYEDGTFSYQEVVERIHAINKVCAPAGNCGLKAYTSSTRSLLTPKSIPELDPTNEFLGAQATIQRWYPDRLLGDRGDPGKDRTLRTVFTHDHFGPSTHQQAGLYAGLLVEPKDSKWTLQDGTPMMTRRDGGPTSWEARILKGNESYREFALEFQDLALAYTSASIGQAVCYPGTTDNPPGCKAYSSPTYPATITTTTPPFGWADPAHSINASNAQNGNRTNPTIISGSVFTGTLSVNYRNEPLALRVDQTNRTVDPPTTPPHNPNTKESDLAFAFASIPRTQPYLNTQPPQGTLINPSGATNFAFRSPFEGAGPFDPYTPLLRAYQDDKIQVRVLVGGYLFNHNFAFHGVKWRFEPSALDSGWRDNQGMGISEHFEFLFNAPVTQKTASTQPCAKNAGASVFCADYLYMPGSGQWDLAQGLWGLMRTYNLGGGTAIPGLRTLPNNSGGGSGKSAVACPSGAPKRTYYVTAKNDKPLFYNARIGVGNSIVNPYPMRFILTDQSWTPLSTDKTPLVLRANAGDCVSVTLKNEFETALPIFTLRDANIPGFQPLGVGSTSGFFASAQAGLHPQLLSYDITKDAGMNIGINPTQTVGPGGTRTYTWYAGNVNGTGAATPIEFGSSNIVPADVIEQPSLSMVGAFVTEPQGSTWPANGPLTADVKKGSTTLFREFVNVFANNVYLYPNNALPPNNTAKFFNAINYSTNSMAYRFTGQNGTNPDNSVTISDAFSNTRQVPTAPAGTEWGDPQPVWVIERNKAFRLRMVHGDGIGGFPDDVIKLHGHVYEEEPYTSASRVIGTNKKSNWTGAREGFGPSDQFDIVLKSAGGAAGIPGDYLLASFPAAEQANGNWGLVRVCDPNQLQLFPCSATVFPLQVGPIPQQRQEGTKHDYPLPAKGADRFLLRTDATTKAEPEPTIHVPANTGTPPRPPKNDGGSGQ